MEGVRRPATSRPRSGANAVGLCVLACAVDLRHHLMRHEERLRIRKLLLLLLLLLIIQPQGGQVTELWGPHRALLDGRAGIE